MLTEVREAKTTEEIAAMALQKAVMSVLVGRSLNRATVQMVEQVVYDHRARCRANGIPFPEMVVLPIFTDSRQQVQLARKDLDESALQTYILNLTVIYPEINAAQIAFAVKYAWPDRKLGNLNLTSKAVQ